MLKVGRYQPKKIQSSHLKEDQKQPPSKLANYCPVISRITILKNSTTMGSIWSAIRLHFRFKTTRAHFLDFSEIHLEHGE